MDFDTAISNISSTMAALQSSYGSAVFDEWAIIILTETSWRVACYTGPRPDGFRGQLPEDLRPLAETAKTKSHAIGDFEFVTDAPGTSHDAMMRIGPSAFLVCNNTRTAMTAIRTNPRWLAAQKSFVALSHTFHSDPLTAFPPA